jgi:hypothetical protein
MLEQGFDYIYKREFLLFVMVKKRALRKRKTSEFQRIEREIDEDVEDVEKWVIERRKFFIKLGWLVALVIILFILSNLLMKVKGVGI